jgi:flagellar biosynthesis protein FliQ
MLGMMLYGLLLNAPFVMLLVLGTIATTGFGAVTPIDMATRRFQPKEILLATQIVAIGGLLMGATIGTFVRYPVG